MKTDASLLDGDGVEQVGERLPVRVGHACQLSGHVDGRLGHVDALCEPVDPVVGHEGEVAGHRIVADGHIYDDHVESRRGAGRSLHVAGHICVVGFVAQATTRRVNAPKALEHVSARRFDGLAELDHLPVAVLDQPGSHEHAPRVESLSLTEPVDVPPACSYMTRDVEVVLGDEERAMPLRKHRNEGLALQLLRDSYKISQGDMAAKLGVSLRTMQRWELGHRLPTREQLTRIAGAIMRDDRDRAEDLAAGFGTSLEILGFEPAASDDTTPPPPPPATPPREAIELALYVAAEQLDVRPSAARAPFVAFLNKLGALGVSCAEAARVLAPDVAAAQAPGESKTPGADANG